MSWACERISFEQLEPAETRSQFALHLAALDWSLAEPIVITNEKDIKSAANWRDRFQPYRHQVDNLIRFCRMLPVTLLADDVGLGKTISAGLILSELIERKRVSRALVVCPAILGPQWVEELASKFGIPALFARGAELANNLQRSPMPVIVTTYHSISARLPTLKADSFDMLIMDEAHKLRNLYGTQKPPQISVRMRRALESRIFKYVTMLTATPIQNRVWDLYSLMDLLTVAKGHANPLGSEAEFRERYVADSAGRQLNPYFAEEFRSILRQYVVRTRRNDAKLKFPTRNVKTQRLRGKTVERKMLEVVAERIQNLNKLVQISLSQAMMSSPQALAAQLENMATRGTVNDAVAREIRLLANTEPRTAKLEGLLALIQELRRERPKDWRVVVFTLRRETQEAIGRALRTEGIAVDFIRGGVPIQNHAAMDRFRASPPKANVIISTDAGAEGVNLQSGNVLVNYDLPWNPMVMEQRIGRIQRLASTHEHVVVINLVIAGSVEERIVGRLMEKLQAISETIGDIETILESAGQDEDSSFEEMIRELVVKSMTGQDVEAATKAAAKSIEDAKQLMLEERSNIDHVFGPGSFQPNQSLPPPKLKPVVPSLSSEDFVRQALVAEGATLRDNGDDTIDVIRRGHAVDRITFSPEMADRGGEAVFMGNAPKLYAPGRPPFERLVQRWLQRAGHAVHDLFNDLDPHIKETASRWCESLPDCTLSHTRIHKIARFAAGTLMCRVKAANGVDSLEKIVSVEFGVKEHRSPSEEVALQFPILPEKTAASRFFPEADVVIQQSLTKDPDVNAFCRYYEARQAEELERAGSNPRLRHRVHADFAPKVFGNVVAMEGMRYDVLDLVVSFILDGDHAYDVEIVAIPASRHILQEPPRKECSITNRTLPLACLSACEVSGKLATRHLLIRSSVSNRVALPEFGATCEATGLLVLKDELAQSDYSGKLVAAKLLRHSSMSDRRGTDDEFDICEFTGDLFLRDELLVSQLSGKHFRKDQASSATESGAIGHQSEFIICAETGQTLVPAEVGESAVSGIRVRSNLLVSSEKPPYRRALRSETRICSVSGKLLLIDEVVSSAVSNDPVDKELAATSEFSGRVGTPAELLTCEATGQKVLRDEVGISALSNKTVRKDLLHTSAISKRLALDEELATCEVTGSRVCPDELLTSDETGRRFRADEAFRSSETKRVGHLSETVECNSTHERVLRSESGVSAITGKSHKRSLLHPSEKSANRFGTEDEMCRCEISGRRLLKDEIVTSAVSGKPMDQDLAARSQLSNSPALPHELIECIVSHQKLLPSEVGLSLVSGKPARLDLLIKSMQSNRHGLPSEIVTCEITGAKVLSDEVVKSDESGLWCRSDETMTSMESGRVAHISEMVECQGTGAWITRSEAAQSSITGQYFKKSLLKESQKPPHRLGIASEFVTCTKTGKSILRDEAVRSAVSNKWIDCDLAETSANSGSYALPEELITCAESGLRLLPNETAVCSILNRAVDKRLLAQSELSGRSAVRTRLVPCAVTGKLAIPNELDKCELTGAQVDPKELEVCAITGKRVDRRRLARSTISGVPMLPEFAVWSPKSNRCCAPTEAGICNWQNIRLPRDEIATCRLTGMSFAREYLNDLGEFRELRSLLDDSSRGEDASDLTGWISQHHGNVVKGVKSATGLSSPDGSMRAICCELRAFLGLRIRHVGMLVSESGQRRLVGRIVIGRRQDGRWVPES